MSQDAGVLRGDGKNHTSGAVTVLKSPRRSGAAVPRSNLVPSCAEERSRRHNGRHVSSYTARRHTAATGPIGVRGVFTA